MIMKKHMLAVVLASGLLALAACTKNETAPEATAPATTGETAPAMDAGTPPEATTGDAGAMTAEPTPTASPAAQ